MKNYTSEVPVSRTVARIEQALVKAGASRISTVYSNGEMVGIDFMLGDYDARGSAMTVRIPVNVPAVESIFLDQLGREPSPSVAERIHQQAGRTAWKLMQDWIEVQLSLIEIQKIAAVQVFLPYLYDGRQTFYEKLRDGGFKLLGPHGEPDKKS